MVMLWNVLCYNPPEHKCVRDAKLMYRHMSKPNCKHRMGILEVHCLLFRCSECRVLEGDDGSMFQCDYCMRGIHPKCRGPMCCTSHNMSPFREVDEDDGLRQVDLSHIPDQFCSAACKGKFIDMCRHVAISGGLDPEEAVRQRSEEEMQVDLTGDEEGQRHGAVTHDLTLGDSDDSRVSKEAHSDIAASAGGKADSAGADDDGTAWCGSEPESAFPPPRKKRKATWVIAEEAEEEEGGSQLEAGLHMVPSVEQIKAQVKIKCEKAEQDGNGVVSCEIHGVAAGEEEEDSEDKEEYVKVSVPCIG